MKVASVRRIAVAAILLFLTASCSGTQKNDGDFVLNKKPAASEKTEAAEIEVAQATQSEETPAAGDSETANPKAVEETPKPQPEIEALPEPVDESEAPLAAPVVDKDELESEPTEIEAPPVGDVTERERVASLYMRAQEYYYKGDLFAAKRLLERIEEDQPYYDMVQRFINTIDADIEAAKLEAEIKREDQAYEDARVHTLYRKAEKAYNDKRYAEAFRIIEQAYKIDPENAKVRTLRADIRIKKANQDMHDNSLNQDARIAEFMSTVERIGTVPSELPRAPRPTFDDEEDPDADAAAKLEEKLNQLVSVNLDSTPLDYLLNILFRTTGVNIVAKPEDLEGKSLTLHVEKIKLIDLLDYISKTLGVTFTRSGNAIWLQGGGDVSAGPIMKWRVVPLNKGLIDVSSEDAGDDSDLEKVLAELPNIIDWPDGSQYYLDRKTNKLFVRTTSEAMEQFIQLVKAVDVTPVQVLIEAKFLEITSKDFSDLGIEWKTTSDFGIGSKNGSNKLQLDAGLGVSLPAPVSAGSDFPEGAGFDGILAGVMTVPQFQMTLHALKAVGHTSSLAEPRLIAINNATAQMEITKDMYYVSDYRIDRQDWNGSSFYSDYGGDTVDMPGSGGSDVNYDFAEPIIVPEYEKEPVGFILKITPSVGRDLHDITLYIEPEITEVVEMLETKIATKLDAGGEPLQVQRPVVSKRTLKAKVTVSDGYVVVLGGLVRQTKEKGQIKVPLLGDIPIIGQLFKHESEKNVKTNLLIFVSAKIITPEGRMYEGAGPGTLNLGGPMDEAGNLSDTINVDVN